MFWYELLRSVLAGAGAAIFLFVVAVIIEGLAN